MKKVYFYLLIALCLQFFVACGEDESTESSTSAGINAGTDAGTDAGTRDNPSPCTPNCSNLDFVQINGGSFMMGSNDGHTYEQPIHMVTVNSFEITRTEVTVGQYQACVQAGACSEPDSGGYCNWNESGREDHPINCVVWDQAVEFAEWAGARLPTEAEWEYAARGEGRDVVYPWGNDEPNSSYAVYSTENGTATVCSKPAGNTPQELCDMAGNVWEWTEDKWHDDYDGAPTDGTAWTSDGSSDRVDRGGSWDYFASNLRVAYRYKSHPSTRINSLGFRVVR